jgi:hypothetical protein
LRAPTPKNELDYPEGLKFGFWKALFLFWANSTFLLKANLFLDYLGREIFSWGINFYPYLLKAPRKWK